MSATIPLRRARSGQGKLFLLMTGLFAIPFLVTALLFAIDWRPAKPAHHGELVASRAADQEARLPLDGLVDFDARPLPAETLGGLWTIAVADPGPCATECRSRLDSVRRIHVALYKQMPRVRRLLLTTATTDAETRGALRSATPDLIIAMPAAAAWQKLLAQASGRDQPDVYVIDPAGRVVMRYSGSFDSRGALRDVERLLKYSWIG